MHLYCAAVYTNNYKPDQARWEKLNEKEREIVVAVPHVLESFHYVKGQRYVDDMRRDGAKVFLDSGAFSMWNIGETIEVSEYCHYIKENLDIIRHDDGIAMASVLDAVGNPLQTYRNQLEMEWRGVTALPCFHFGEDERYLEYYMSKYPYITIGGMVKKTADQLTSWLDRIWNRYILDGAGRPRAKFHGFGLTSVSLMERYPWYSTDSSSWIQAAAFGSIYHPLHGPIAVSSKSPSRHDKGRHLTTLTAPEQEYVLADLARRGFSVDRLATIYESRAAFNLSGYCELNTLMNNRERPITAKPIELLQ